MHGLPQIGLDGKAAPEDTTEVADVTEDLDEEEQIQIEVSYAPICPHRWLMLTPPRSSSV
jgi:hypothetical protein